MIIRAGRHIYPDEIESAVGEVPEIRKGCVAVFGHVDSASGTEQLVVMAETSSEGLVAQVYLRDAVRKRVVTLLGEPPDVVVLVPINSVLKTSSGKIRRAANRALYEETNGHIRPQSKMSQLLRLSMSAGRGVMGHGFHRMRELIWGGYFWSMLGIVAIVTWPLTVIRHTPAKAWGPAHGMLRFFVRLAGIPFNVTGTENLPSDTPHIIVANHSSYLDTLFLLAALPRHCDCLVKAELRRNLFARVFLATIGAQFIDRFNPAASVEGANQVVALARGEHSYIIFPEGTFTRAPGVMPFHLGAFKAAVETQLPIVPVVIAGARSMLRDGQWRPRRGPIRVDIGGPIAPVVSGDPFNAAARLRNAAQEYITTRCGEPAIVGLPNA